MAWKKSDRFESVEMLRKWLKPGDTVYTVLRKVAPSGMSRCMDLYVIEDGEPLRLTFHAARALDWSYEERTEALRVAGCGMDAGFHAVYSLGSVLWPQGTPEPHGTRNSQPDSAGGYALKHRWL